jgi:hypothetical protein
LQQEVNVTKDTLGELGFRFDMTNPRVYQWIERHAADLVVGIDTETKEAIRQIVARMFREGIPPRSAARLIREVVGLTVRQATALDTYRASLGDTERAEQLVEQYSTRLLTQRGELIARTESMTAANQAQHELWKQARDEGFLEEERTKRKWIVTPDSRLCALCSPIPGQGPVGLDEPFIGGDGSVVMNPPLHPACRCTTALAFTD